MEEGPSVVKAMTIRQVVFLSKGKGSAGPWHLEAIFVDFETHDFRIERAGSPSFMAAPDGPETCP